MKRFPIWPAVLVAAIGCGHVKDQSKTNPGELTPIPEMSAYSLGEPMRSGNLSVVPVVYKNKMEPPTEDYATLAEGIKNGWIEILEMPYGQVNTLRVRNTGPKAVLMLGGELLVGGKQDRVLVKDVVVPPGKTVEVEVNCVEHGRWTGSSDSFKGGDTMVPLHIRDEAAYGTQEGVWKKVGEYNDQAKAASDATIRGGMASADVQKRIGDDLERLSSALRAQGNVVGVIIAVDGHPRSLEIFGSPSLFASSQDVILKGALAEVALSGNADAPAPSMDECKSFFSDCMNAQRRRREANGATNTFSADAPNVQGAEIAGSDYGGKPAAAANGLVHGTYRSSSNR